MIRPPPQSKRTDTPFPYTTLSRSCTRRRVASNSSRSIATVRPASSKPMSTRNVTIQLRVRGAREAQEHVLQIGFAGRHVHDAIAFRLHRGEHVAVIGLVLGVGDREHPIALQLEIGSAHVCTPVT